MSTSKFNDVPLRNADTREEKLLLGFIHQQAERIGYGQLMLELRVRNGKMETVKSTEVSRTFNLGQK